MIFKTIDGDLKVFNKTILSTNGNLNTLNSNVNNISSFTKLSNAIKRYNNVANQSASFQQKYNAQLQNSTSSVGKYLQSLNGAKASMGGYIKSLIGAKAASIGLQVASLALNAAISMGLSLAISALISGISKWINKEKEAREQAIETANTAKEEVSNLTELLNKYNQLSEEIKTNTSAKDSLMSTQEELLKALGVEQSELDGLISKYGDLSTAINQVALDALKDAQPDLLTGYSAYKEELLKVGGDGFWGGKNLINATGDNAVKAFQELQKAGIIDSGSYGTAGGVFALVGDDSTVEGILENYGKLKSAQEALDQAVENGVFTKEELSENSLYNAIADKEKELRSYVDNYNSAIDDVNENSANQEIISNLMGKELPKNAEEFESFKKSLIDTAQASNNFIGTQQDIKDSVINALAEMPEFKQYFEDLAEVQDLTLNNETPVLTISDTITKLNSQLRPAFDSLKSAYQSIFTEDGFTLKNVDLSMLDSIKSSIEDLNKIDGIEIDYSSFENLVKILTDSSSTAEEVTNGINTLATEIVSSLNPAIKDASGESYLLVQQTLESLGVQNAEQVMISSLGYTYEEYTAAKEECKNAGLDLAYATEDEIAKFIEEKGGAENCGEALALLQLKKLLVNTTRIDQTSDINNILTLASAAGVASDSMLRLANAKTLLDTAIANNDARGIAVAKQELIDAGKNAKDSILDFKPVELNFSPASNPSKSSGSSKDKKDLHLEAYKKELAELEHLHEMEMITDKEFYDSLSVNSCAETYGNIRDNLQKVTVSVKGV